MKLTLAWSEIEIVGKGRRHKSRKFEQYYGESYTPMLRVTEPTGQRLRYSIEGREGRYDGLTIWQTKQCGLECKDFRKASLRNDVFGVCTKGVAWKVIIKNRTGRTLRACQVNQVDHRG